MGAKLSCPPAPALCRRKCPRRDARCDGEQATCVRLHVRTCHLLSSHSSTRHLAQGNGRWKSPMTARAGAWRGTGRKLKRRNGESPQIHESDHQQKARLPERKARCTSRGASALFRCVWKGLLGLPFASVHGDRKSDEVSLSDGRRWEPCQYRLMETIARVLRLCLCLSAAAAVRRVCLSMPTHRCARLRVRLATRAGTAESAMLVHPECMWARAYHTRDHHIRLLTGCTAGFASLPLPCTLTRRHNAVCQRRC